MFVIHPYDDLVRLFAAKPYQGAKPEDSALVFVGLDANYAADIDRQPVFPQIIEYHSNGPQFWQEHGVHHPFLLPSYRGSGRKYHRNFAQIGFNPRQAEKISFVELLAVPTVGRSLLTSDDFDRAHLRFLREMLFHSKPKSVFVSPAVANLMNRTGAFPRLNSARTCPDPGLSILFESSNITVYKHLHFSVYGKYEAQRLAEASAIRDIGLRL